MDKLYLVDGMALIYRAHFAMIRNPLLTSDGRHTSAIFGFFNSLFKLIIDENPEYLVVVMDSKEPTFRHDIYPEYKATREKMPEELIEQLAPIFQILDSAGIAMIRKPGFEADDIIGTLVTDQQANSMESYIITGDKDLMQLVDNSTFVYTPGNRFKPTTIYDSEKVKEKWGVEPTLIPELLALMGDTSDNIPGVEGVGSKTAAKLLNEYKSIENVFNHAEDVRNKRVSAGLIKGRDTYQLSMDLVKIDKNVPLNSDADFSRFKQTQMNGELILPILQEFELFSLVKLLDPVLIKDKSVAQDTQKNYLCLFTENELSSAAEKIKSTGFLALDTETTSTDALTTELVGISLSIEENSGWYIPVMSPEKSKNVDIELIKKTIGPVLADSDIKKSGQNIKFDIHVLINYGFDVNGIEFDTMVAAHLLEPGLQGYKLDDLSVQNLGYTMKPITDLIGEGKNQCTMDEIGINDISFYAAEDADVTLQLAHHFREKLKKDELDHCFDTVEMPLVPVIIKMEKTGVFIDKEFLSQISLDLEKKLTETEEDIHGLAGREFNINSPKQLGEILFDDLKLKPIRKRSTNVHVLEVLKYHHPLPEKILEYRQYKKLKSTYVDALPDHINPITERIHTNWNQTIAATGRLSSTHPNFQNIPIRTELGREVRKAFCAQEEGYKIFSADYSQIELRIMAHLSEEPELINAFENDEDIHARTASLVFKEHVEKITPDQRRAAKVVNFGIMYGAGPFRMSQELGITMAEARQLIDEYFQTYSGIKNYIDESLAFARDFGFVKTIYGRKKKTKFLNTDNRMAAQAESRAAINMPIQGSASEMIKLAMIGIHQKLNADNYQSKMTMQVHDELVFEVHDDEIDSLSEMVVKEMENAIPLKVPVKVETGIGKNWFEAH